MRKRLITLLFFAGISLLAQGQENLYPVFQNKRWGYINSKGHLIIQPLYRSAQVFSEGLAAVRLNGTYGYIDEKGNTVIPFTYDYATEFKNGQAKVFIDGKPYYIDKKGNKKFEHTYPSLEYDGNNRYFVQTATNKMGVLNSAGKLIIDTAFRKISKFTNGVSVVTGLNNNPPGNIYECGVIDSTGKWIVSYGKYAAISSFQEGYADVEFPDERDASNDRINGVIDTKGNLLLKEAVNVWHFRWPSYNTYSNGLRTIELYLVAPKSITDWSSNSHNSYYGCVNTKGEIVFSNKDWYDITPFSCNRVFVKNANEKWILIDRSGRRIGKDSYDEIMDSYVPGNSPEVPFYNGIAFVRNATYWSGIDTSGKVIFTKKFDKGFSHLERFKNIIVFQKDADDLADIFSGVWDYEDNVFIKPIYGDIDYDAVGKEPLICVSKNRLMGYINNKNKVIWMEDSRDNSNLIKDTLNIDVMNGEHFMAAAGDSATLNNLGDLGTLFNTAKPIPTDLMPKENSLQLFIDTTKKTFWYDKYAGYKLFLFNTSQKTYYFGAEDGMVYMNLQAQDANGVWRDIEYIRHSWCGNSYHTIYLAKNQYWQFTIPMYKGGMKTQIRAKIAYKETDSSESEILYSNPIEGSINPAQLWRERMLILPTAIMHSDDE